MSYRQQVANYHQEEVANYHQEQVANGLLRDDVSAYVRRGCDEAAHLKYLETPNWDTHRIEMANFLDRRGDANASVCGHCFQTDCEDGRGDEAGAMYSLRRVG